MTHKHKIVYSVDYNLIPDSLWIMNTVPGCFSHEEPEIRAVKWARGDVIEPRYRTLGTHSRQFIHSVRTCVQRATGPHTHIRAWIHRL